MTPALCYIAAPYGDPSPTIRAWHVSRARLLARLALACGYAPIVVHGEIEAGTYGDDSDPEQRARGMAASAAICRGVLATPGAVLWALLRDDGERSEGVAAEMRLAVDGGAGMLLDTWKAWRLRVAVHAPQLLPEWDRLAVRPDAVGEPCAWYKAHTGQRRAYPSGITAAHVDRGGWAVYRPGEAKPFDQGPEVKAAGRAAADAALRAAGVAAVIATCRCALCQSIAAVLAGASVVQGRANAGRVREVQVEDTMGKKERDARAAEIEARWALRAHERITSGRVVCADDAKAEKIAADMRWLAAERRRLIARVTKLHAENEERRAAGGAR